MRYRYVIRKNEWQGSEDDWEQLLDYAKTNFSNVLETPYSLYFNATPEQLRFAANALRIDTTDFDILSTSMLEPSTHRD